MRYIVDIDGTICEHFNGPNLDQVKFTMIELKRSINYMMRVMRLYT